MTVLEIQNSPYSLQHKNFLLSISDINKTTCFVGEIEKLKLLKIGVVGIFTIENYDSLTYKTEIVFLKPFYYDCPKYQFSNNDCLEATHFLITSEFESNEESYKSFLNNLSHSKINKEQMKYPC